MFLFVFMVLLWFFWEFLLIFWFFLLIFYDIGDYLRPLADNCACGWTYSDQIVKHLRMSCVFEVISENTISLIL